MNCNLEVDETIVHFLGECNFYEQFRLQYFAGKLFLFDDCIRILNGSFGWKNLASFVKDSWVKRTNNLK